MGLGAAPGDGPDWLHDVFSGPVYHVAAESEFMRNPQDSRDWNADPDKDPRTHTQDLFAIKFVKP